jgi:hypothetical protein
MDAASEDVLGDAQAALRSRFDDFRRAFDRRDEAAYQVALTDFHDHLRRWTLALEQTLLPALGAVSAPRRDLQREIRLDFVQLRELTRYVLEQISTHAPLADIVGLVENLNRRLSAHESQIQTVYRPAAAAALDEEAWRTLRAARPH